MGQAKLRGSFEDRRNNAILRNKEKREHQARIKLEHELSLTPEEKASRQRAQIAYDSFFAIVNDMMNPHRHDFEPPRNKG